MNTCERASVSFGPFCLSPATRELERDGVPVKLGNRALDILIVLIEHAGTVVSHRELMSRVWRDLVVAPSNLRVHMTALRKALGDGRDGARYIANVTGQGYCFVAEAIRDVPAKAPESAQPAESSGPSPDLPARLTRMIGRQEIVEAICDDLGSERFITIIGPGGMGKTTVAVAVAHEMGEDFGGMVSFVDMGAISNPALAEATIASSLGLAVQTDDTLSTLLDHLRNLRILLVLDNCEHVIDAVATLTETLFNEASEVHILVTSREALRVEGERVYWLPALPSPPPGSSMSSVDVFSYPAAQLFLERAAAGGGRVEASDENAPLVAEICGRLEGIPLAIELAAGRAGSHGIVATADLLSKTLALDWRGRRTAPPRHQTIRALLDWSYAFLPEDQQVALRKLSVLVGPFTVETAAALLRESDAGETVTLNAIDDLVAKSLISVQPGCDGATHYRLLETTRAFGLEKLQECGEADGVMRLHTQYLIALLDSQHGGQVDLEHTGRAGALRGHLGNVRAGLEWCFANLDDPTVRQLAVHLAAAATPVFFELLLLSESYRWSGAARGILDESTSGGRREMVLRST